MAGEIQLNSVSLASESSGTITINNAIIGSAVAMAANQACVKTALNASGSADIFACRAWINFDGSSGSIGTGRANGNISGVADNGGNGLYTISFTNNMEDANYVVVHTTSNDATGVTRGHGGLNLLHNNAPSAGSFQVQCAFGADAGSNGSAQDPSLIHLAIFR